MSQFFEKKWQYSKNKIERNNEITFNYQKNGKIFFEEKEYNFLKIFLKDFGLFYKDVPEDCFVKIDWKRNGDAKYIQEKLEYAWKHREELSKKSR